MTTLRLLHVSDTHGHFPELHDSPYRAPVVIHSGDFLPNRSRGNLAIEPVFQEAWVRANAPRIREWLLGRSFYLCMGNHDFYNPVELLRSFGIDAHDLTNRTETISGLTFHGFPYVPPISGEWNWETQEEDIRERLKHVPTVDVFVAHCPPGSILDSSITDRCGSDAIASWFAYAENRPTKAYLCGHVHESYGVTVVDGRLVSNAATTQQVLEIWNAD